MRRLIGFAAGLLALAVFLRAGISRAELKGLAGAAVGSPTFLILLSAFSLLSALIAVLALRQARSATRRSDHMGRLIEANLASRENSVAQKQQAATPGTLGGLSARRTDRRPSPVSGIETAQPDLAFQPIVSLSRNEAVAFDAVDLTADVADRDPLSWDIAVLRAAAEAVVLRPEALGLKSLVFVPVSAAFLADPGARTTISTLVRGRPALARGLCLRLHSLPERAALESLAGLSLGGVAVSRLPEAGETAVLASLGVSHLRVVADELLNPYAARRIPAWQAVEAARAAGLAIIACGVTSIDDATRLLDQGIDLMSGTAFSGPRRLRALEEQAEPSLARHRAALRNG